MWQGSAGDRGPADQWTFRPVFQSATCRDRFRDNNRNNNAPISPDPKKITLEGSGTALTVPVPCIETKPKSRVQGAVLEHAPALAVKVRIVGGEDVRRTLMRRLSHSGRILRLCRASSFESQTV